MVIFARYWFMLMNIWLNMWESKIDTNLILEPGFIWQIGVVYKCFWRSWSEAKSIKLQRTVSNVVLRWWPTLFGIQDCPTIHYEFIIRVLSQALLIWNVWAMLFPKPKEGWFWVHFTQYWYWSFYGKHVRLCMCKMACVCRISEHVRWVIFKEQPVLK